MLLLGDTLFDAVVLAWILLALALFPLQLKIAAPFGRHRSAGWGPVTSNHHGWIVMELVSLVVFAALFLGGNTGKNAVMWFFFALWIAHYTHRSLIFPLRMRTGNKQIPVLIVAAATVFNTVNAGLNGYYLGWLSEPYPNGWLSDPRFVIGLALFFAGAAINIWADNRLIALRGTGRPEYSIPEGGLFDYVSCPNHLGEIIEWVGFAVLCWNLPALSFGIWTAANLIPRSLSHHSWYRRQFSEYPVHRKAVIPLLL